MIVVTDLDNGYKNISSDAGKLIQNARDQRIYSKAVVKRYREGDWSEVENDGK